MRDASLARRGGPQPAAGVISRSPPLLTSCFHDFAQKWRTAINESGVQLNKLRASLKFSPRRFCVANSTGRDHWNCGFCHDITEQYGGFFAQGRSAQAAFLV